MYRLLWLSDSPTRTTGYGTVARQVLRRLHQCGEYQLLCFGWGYAGEPVNLHEFPYEIRPATTPDSDTLHLQQALSYFRPDFLITLGDVWAFDWIAHLLGFERTQWIGYFPIDSGPVPRACIPTLERCHHVVTPSRFGQEQFQAALPGREIPVIPHGVDPSVFRPLREAGGPNSGRFVVGFVGRNQPRKQIPLLMRAFAEFARDKPEALLYLHTAGIDSGWDLNELVERYGLVGRCEIALLRDPTAGVPEEELNRLYIQMDVFVLPSTGEGFGLPTLEAMAAGVPVVATDCSASRELVGGRGELIRVAAWEVSPWGNLEFAIMDENHLVEILNRLYQDRELRAVGPRPATASTTKTG